MTWEYGAIGFVAGLIFGVLMMMFGTTRSRDINKIQKELDKTKAELGTYRNEMKAHFANSADLLDKMAQDYRQLYDYMAKSSMHFIAGSESPQNLFKNTLPTPKDQQANIEASTADLPPRDYSDGSSGLFNKGTEQK